jgi:hypothetical protein
MRGLEHWWHILLSSPFKVTVITDHLNLKYYREGRKINRCVARYIPHLGDYNIQLVHKPGVTNKADLLSRCPDFDQGKVDNEEVLVLPPHLFVNVAEEERSLEELVQTAQQGQEETLQCLREEVGIQLQGNRWCKENVLVVLDEGL